MWTSESVSVWAAQTLKQHWPEADCEAAARTLRANLAILDQARLELRADQAPAHWAPPIAPSGGERRA